MRVVNVEHEDLDAVTDMWVSLADGQRAYGSHLVSEDNRGRIRRSLARHVVTGGLLAASVGDRLVGFVMYSMEHGEYEQDVARGVVHNLFVEPDYRGIGIGSTLLERAETDLEAKGAEVVALEVLAANEGAHTFYERCGYVPHRIEYEKRVETDNTPG